jgi:hypothetical protein
MTGRNWTDEQLSAFLDGELSAQDTDALSQEIERDARLAARMDRLGSASTAYVDAVGQIDRAPISAGLKTAIETPPASRVIAFRPRSLTAFVAEHRAVAASLLCAAAVWGVMSAASNGSQSDPFAPGPDGVVMANSPLHRLLETAPTGQASTVGSATAAPRLTFAADDGSYCRQFDVVTDEGVSAAIACREDAGWRTQLVAYGLSRPTGDFQTASAARSPALESFLDAHMSGAPMNTEEEARLLENGWTPASP